MASLIFSIVSVAIAAVAVGVSYWLGGASTRELMGRMGHASMRAALNYQHRTADRDRLIADALDTLIDAAQKTRSEPNGSGEGGDASP